MVWSLEPGMQWFGRASVEKRSYHGLLTPVHLNFKGRFDDAETTKGGSINGCTLIAGWFMMENS